MMRRNLVLTALLGAATLSAHAAESKAPSPGFDVAYIDPKADPCADFFLYACGNWLAKNPVPPDRPIWNRGYELSLRNGAIERSILENDREKLGDDYAACMDEDTIEARGTTPIVPLVDRVRGMKSKSDLPSVLAKLHMAGVGALFELGSEPDFKDTTRAIAVIDQGGLSLPDREYYVGTDEKSQGIRKRYAAHLERMFTLMGDGPALAAAEAKTVLDIETALAKVSMGRVERRSPANLYHPTSRQELGKLTPAFAWERYLRALDAPRFATLNVASPDFLKGVEAQLGTVGLDDWKVYLRWCIVREASPLLPKAFVSENFDFFGRALRGAKELRPRWQRCLQVVESHQGEALGRKFVEKTFGPEGKERTLRIVEALRAALQNDIASLDWMTDATKKAALAKLHAILTRMAYPDKWRDYTGLVISRKEAVGNAQRSSAFEAARSLKKIGGPVDRAEWPFPPTTVNAGYEPLANTITFSAAILQPPFYENGLDDAVNLGAVGSMIGHELTHGFDDQGRQFDAGGNMRDWWTPEDAKEFADRSSCFVDQYSSYTTVGDTKLNGKLTLGENIADNGGVRLSLAALAALSGDSPRREIDGFTPEQRFFLAFSQIACENRTDEMAAMRARVDPHAPGRFRVNGVVSNMPEFAKAFGCAAKAEMVREHICRVW